MKVGAARKAAIEWVDQYASQDKGFRGAYFSGSTVGQPEDEELSASSDIDVVIVTEADAPPIKLGKFDYKGALVEVTYLSWKQLESPEEVLTSYHLAGSFRMDSIISDPTGHLRKLQIQVSQHFAEWAWVHRRCGNARERIEIGLKTIDTSAPLFDRITSWLFPTGVTTHVLLVAALRNPTVRLRYLAAREVLISYGHMDIYQELLELLGCHLMTPRRVDYHVRQLARTFDVAAKVAKTPFFFSTDITTSARPIAIDGSLKLIQTGFHHEAVFWIVATFARCHKILAADGSPELQHELLPAFEEIIADLGITSTDILLDRAEKVIHYLPRLWDIAEQIMSVNPHIVNKKF
ncbi:hypothetical protein SAMN05661091_2365 [Paenibacillus uliginis N3/975]|uniref:Uncharacterized protein n=1 Tax=Paenibacillus uliginis N3/975 TaxID=1313296 RepID=A0A1X7HCU3_9BACL|nr:hypothetical protein [Paenibacillus uliginis]SMF83364.1 hypothetical protein SAMN05661091_2365 [Paenibacillus uliginis N3/975]